MFEKYNVGPCRTLFVRNLPYNTSNEELEEAFSDIGPTKKCFVVKDKDTDGCKGYGYVTFSMVEDAIKAKTIGKVLSGRRLGISFADKSRKIKQKHEKKNDTDQPEDEVIQNVTDVQPCVPANTSAQDDIPEKDGEPKQNEDAKRKQEAKKYLNSRTVVLTGFPINTVWKEIEALLQKNIKHLARIDGSDKEGNEVKAHLRFKCIKDARRAIRRINSMELKGIKLKAMQMKEITHNRTASNLKQSRLIVRNLSFKCTEHDLREAFKKFGNLSEVSIPQKDDGHKHGFGFVQFTSVAEADNAIKAMNTREILGRPVAVDWSVPRKVFQKRNAEEKDKKNDKSIETKIPTDDQSTEESSDDEKSSDPDSESEEESSSEDDSEDTENQTDTTTDDDDSVESESDVPARHKSVNKVRKKESKYMRNDVDEKRTLFIRGIPFSSTEEDVEETFLQFGELVYARIVMDKFTNRSKGTAFVQFKTKESASHCLKQADFTKKAGGLAMGGRSLTVTHAIRREEVTDNLKKEKMKENKDVRNLWLAREGMIRPGTKEAEGVSKADLDKRVKIVAMKRQKLKNPNIFISPTRLCVRNIPTTVDEPQLRQIFLKAAGDKSAKLTECRIMRDLNRVNSKGVGKSRGYAFVDFSEHRCSLSALKSTNNNAEIFGDKKRPIVEFSLENKVALNAKKRRMEKMMEIQTLKKIKKDEGISNLNKKTLLKQNKKKEPTDESFQIAKQSYTGPKKGLPKHLGPKVRHKPRQAQHVNKKNTVKILKKTSQVSKVLKRNAYESGFTKESPSKKRKSGKRQQPDNFEQLVNKYRSKLSATDRQKSKWFQV